MGSPPCCKNKHRKAAQAITEAFPKASDVQSHQSLKETLSQAYSSVLKGDVATGGTLLVNELIIPGAVGLLGLIAVYFVSKFIASRIASKPILEVESMKLLASS
ncbi:MAG: hypothetical protein U0930_15065 [Pirellulales bacterium]